MHPWIALRYDAGDTPGFGGYPEDQRCYREMLRHYALLGTSVFLWWNTTALPRPDGTSGPITDRDALATEMDGTMTEINARTGGVVRSTIGSEPISFEATVVITGAVRADGRCIWRVSARPDVRALRNVVTGEVVTLPGDEIGFWVERDDATEAVVVRTDSDRLSQVFINLVTNARKYCDAAKPKLRIEATSSP